MVSSSSLCDLLEFDNYHGPLHGEVRAAPWPRAVHLHGDLEGSPQLRCQQCSATLDGAGRNTSYIEVRYMKLLGRSSDFWICWSLDFLEVEWKSLQTGPHIMKEKTQEFLMIKSSQGMAALPEVEGGKLVEDLVRSCNEQSDGFAEKNKRLEKFFKDMADQLPNFFLFCFLVRSFQQGHLGLEGPREIAVDHLKPLDNNMTSMKVMLLILDTM